MSTLSYEKAGVPHLKGDDQYNKKISSWIGSTKVPGVLGNAHGFASLFDIQKTKINNPLLVTATDGVGTKLEIATLQKKHDTIGIDLVAMCVNDLITCGARPFVFLDYFATGKFDNKKTAEVLKGIVKGCRESQCALVGGETAIMPGFYQAGSGEYDIAGFAVGLVDKKKLIDGKKVKKGDVVLGLASSGFHSNGYSLLRKVFKQKDLKGAVGKELLKPTKLYVKPVIALQKAVRVHAMANITGGGLIDNVPRVLPKGLTAKIDLSAWPVPTIFKKVQEAGNIATREMIRTFNMGIGYVIVLSAKDVAKAQATLKKFKIRSWVIGEIVRGKELEVA